MSSGGDAYSVSAFQNYHRQAQPRAVRCCRGRLPKRRTAVQRVRPENEILQQEERACPRRDHAAVPCAARICRPGNALEKAKEPTLSDLLVDYFNLRNEQRSDWSGKAKLKCTVRDFEEVTKPKPPLPRIPIYKKNAGRTFRKGEGSACFFAPLPHFSLRRKCATIALA